MMTIKREQTQEMKWMALSHKYHPYLYHLNTIEWFIFGTLTWDKPSRRFDSDKAEHFRSSDFNQLMKEFRIRHNIGRRHLAYYKATEFGATDEGHVHFLIAKKGLENQSVDACCNTLSNLWKNELTPVDSLIPGISRQVSIQAYDTAKQDFPAVKYCLKKERDNHGIERERHDFLSPALISMIKKQNRMVGEISPIGTVSRFVTPKLIPLGNSPTRIQSEMAEELELVF